MELESLSNEPEVTDVLEDAQPEESVVDESGDEQPQSSSESEEYDVVLGGDDQESQQAPQVPLYKLKKLREKNKAIKSENANVLSENEQLKAEMERVRREVAALSAGSKPDPLDYSDSEQFYADLEAYNAKLNVSPEQRVESSQPTALTVPDEVLDNHYARVSDMASKYNIKDYDAAESGVLEKLESRFPSFGGALAEQIISNTGDKSHLVMYALEKSEAKFNKLADTLLQDAKSGTRNTEKLLWKWENEAKIEGRTRSVGTKPESIPEGTGSSSSLENQIQKAYDNWVKSGSVADHQKLKTLRKQKAV